MAAQSHAELYAESTNAENVNTVATVYFHPSEPSPGDVYIRDNNVVAQIGLCQSDTKAVPGLLVCISTPEVE